MQFSLRRLIYLMLISLFMIQNVAYAASLSFEVDKGTVDAIKSGDYTYSLLEDGTIALLAIDGQGKRVDVPSTIDGYTVTSIGLHGFRMLSPVIGSQAEIINYPNSMRIIGKGSIAYHLSGSTIDRIASGRGSNEPISYPEGVVEIGGMNMSVLDQYGISNDLIKSVELPDSLRSIADETFQYYGIKSIGLPNQLEAIGDYAFSGCMDLKKVSIPATVQSIGAYAFSDNFSLSSVSINANLTFINEGVFSKCKKLSKIALPETVTEIGASAFSECSKLSKIAFDKTALITIGDKAFNNCTALTSIILPDTTLTIGKEAFYGCKKLAKVVLPQSVTSIGDYAFDGCAKNITFTVIEGSYAEKWATENGYKTKMIK